jgi:Rrf2 family iron-sulfur cluster assembly transcriptional regulator
MKVSSKTLYTLHFLSALAIKGRKGPVHLREISEEYAIPFKFLEQIAILMKTVGLVRGTRGKSGGYQLAELPENIDLSRVIKATEGEILPCADIEGGNEIVGGLLDKIFQDQREIIDTKLTGITLAHIAETARRRMEPAPMFYL